MNVWQIVNVISLDAVRGMPIRSITDVYKGAEP
jgi:hypothetical protein